MSNNRPTLHLDICLKDRHGRIPLCSLRDRVRLLQIGVKPGDHVWISNGLKLTLAQVLTIEGMWLLQPECKPATDQRRARRQQLRRRRFRWLAQILFIPFFALGFLIAWAMEENRDYRRFLWKAMAIFRPPGGQP